MFNQKKNQNQKERDEKISPNFLHSLDGNDFVEKPIAKIKQKIKKEIRRDKKIIKEREQEIIKPIYRLERKIEKVLQKEHDKFDQGLAASEKELKKIRQEIYLAYKKNNPKSESNKIWQLKWYKSLFSFFLVLLFLVVPFKILAYLQVFNLSLIQEKILTSSKSAVDNLIGAGAAASEFNMSAAQNRFAVAGNDFLRASDDMAVINDTLLSLASLSSNPKLKLAAESKKFLRVGVLGSSLGNELSQALTGISANSDGNWIKILDEFSIHGHQAITNANDLNAELQKINVKNLPEEYQSKFLDISGKVKALPANLSVIVDNLDELKIFLGAGRDKRYLLVFQNNAEMRGSGGFLGSYALVDFREGKIRNLEVPGGGSYDTEAGLTEKVKAPSPLWLVNPLWHFWDANWWPDWPTTAKNLMWFYEKSDGPSVDGVISFTPSVIEKLLTITGPIDMTKDYGLVITSDNFWEQVELTAERDNIVKTNPEVVSHLPVGQTAKPKKIIGDLMAKIMEVLPQKMDKENIIKLLSIFQDSLASKQIMFYFNDPKLEAAVSSRNWGGVMTAAPMDYLMVTNTNIAGSKTDRVISEEIRHQATVSADGSIIDTLTITRTHLAAKNTPLVGVRNVDWMRVYVPIGSELISASGFISPDAKYFENPDPSWLDNEFVLQNEGQALTDGSSGTKIYQENNKTVFANWSMLDPGTSQTITLQYRIPFNMWQVVQKTDFFSRLNSWLNSSTKVLYPYSMSIQKQPGSEREHISTDLILPSFAKLTWDSNDNSKASLQHDFLLNQDQFYSALIANK